MQALTLSRRSQSIINTPLGNFPEIEQGEVSLTIPVKYHHKSTKPSEPNLRYKSP